MIFGKKDNQLPVEEVASMRVPTLPFDKKSRAFGNSDIPYLSEKASRQAMESEKRASAHVLKPTRVPLSSSSVNLGLGHDSLNDLHLVEEEIGLSRPVITKDYPSPPNYVIRYGETDILPLNATKAKERISVVALKPKVFTPQALNDEPFSEPI